MGISSSPGANGMAKRFEPLVLVALGAAVALGAGSLLLLAAVGALFVWMAARMESRDFAALSLGLLVAAPWQQIAVADQNPVYDPVMWAALLLILVLVARRGFPRLDRCALFDFGLVLIWAVLGILLGHGQFGRSATWVLFWVLGFGVFVLLSVRDALRRVIQNCWWVGAALGAYAIVEWMLKDNVLFGNLIQGLWAPSFYASATFRITATLGHPIVAGAVFGFLLTLLAWAWTNGLLAPRLFAAGFIPCAAALVLTGDRGALIVTVLALLVVIAVPGAYSRRRAALLLGLILAFVVVVTVIPTTLESRFADMSRDSSFLQRTAGLTAASTVVAREPLWGMGAGYGDFALRDLGYIETNYETEYAGLLIGLGIPGAVLVLGLPLVALFRSSGRRVRLAFSVAPFAVYAIGILGPSNMFDWWGGTILFWTAIGFVTMGDKLLGASPECK